MAISTGILGWTRNVWNVFLGRTERYPDNEVYTVSGDGRVSGYVTTRGQILEPIKVRISVDCSNVPIRHVRVNKEQKIIGYEDSSLNALLSLMPNEDQTSKIFFQDAVNLMLDKGSVAIVPVETTSSPDPRSMMEIHNLRVGEIVENLNYHVRVLVYNIRTGRKEELTLPKGFIAIAHNPLYRVMNTSNSTLARLSEKAVLLDNSDRQSSGNQLDLILQLPFAARSSRRKLEAEKRLNSVEDQLTKSGRGIAYVDATEKITQLNRPVLNTLPDQVAALQERLYNEVGITRGIIDGSASPEELTLYYTRTVQPILDALVSSMSVSFLSATSRSQGHAIRYHQELFKMAPISVIAEAADKFTRNEIVTANEVRNYLGLPQSNQKGADELRNKNIAEPKDNDPEGKKPEVPEEDIDDKVKEA